MIEEHVLRNAEDIVKLQSQLIETNKLVIKLTGLVSDLQNIIMEMK